jgi:hypothetical protein
MDIERTIDDIEQIQEMFETPDIRPLSAGDISAAIEGTTKCSRIVRGFNLATYGLCCRPESQCFDWASG